jgi:hypothetical protein
MGPGPRTVTFRSRARMSLDSRELLCCNPPTAEVHVNRVLWLPTLPSKPSSALEHGPVAVAAFVMVVACSLSCTIVTTAPAPSPAPLPPPQAAYTAPPPYAPPPTQTRESVVDERGRSINLEHGAPVDPGVAGCADGQREAFLDLNRYPHIAGCLASWQGRQSLRANPTGRACGDELGPCAVPADACAPGWHVCGASGAVQELRAVDAEACENAGGGRYAAAISHCKTQRSCSHDDGPNATYECFAHGYCSEPVCCGRDCGQFGICRDGVWKQHTHIPFGQDQGCASTESRRAGGVLCCRG